MTKHKRRIKLIKPTLQIRLTMVFVGLAAFGLILQILLFTSHLSQAMTYLPDGGPLLATVMDSILLRVMLVSVSVILPLTFAVGILTTFRIAGPLYRFEVWLEQVRRGEDTGPCRLRKGDHLNELCAKLNETVDALRERASERPETAGRRSQPREDRGPEHRDVA